MSSRSLRREWNTQVNKLRCSRPWLIVENLLRRLHKNGGDRDG